MLAREEARGIRVLIADDHEVVRIGIGRMLENTPDIDVVGVARDGAEAIALCAEHAPDVVLMDLEMPGIDGLEATRSIVRAGGPSVVVVLTSFADRDHIAEAIDSGAVGYLLKDADPRELVAGIRAAAAGESPLTPRVALTVVRELRTAGTGGTLSDREREVLALVGAGVANKQIALRLGISTKTVKSHLSHIFRQIGVRDRLQAAMWARRHGLVPGASASDRGPTES
jgi:DNA-binding NarL/FixJ family response regulator